VIKGSPSTPEPQITPPLKNGKANTSGKEYTTKASTSTTKTIACDQGLSGGGDAKEGKKRDTLQ